MSSANFSAILSVIGQFPAALIATAFVLGGAGIGIGMIFRDVPRYIYKIIHDILSFILYVLILKLKNPTDDNPDGNDGKNNSHIAETFKVIEGGKSGKEDDRHEDEHAT